MQPLSLTAPAKLNLWLELRGGVRPDGRHELRSHFAPLELSDRLTLQPADAFGLIVEGPFSAQVPTDQRNLLWQAYDGFSKRFAPLPPAYISLEKNIPHGAGLGGGSSDAGALLGHLANEHNIPLEEVRAWSLRLGADVPAAIGPHCGLVTGVGEQIGEFIAPPKSKVLLIKPQESCPTGAVFRAYKEAGAAPAISRNDLEMAARKVCPSLGPILDYLRTEVHPEAQITGSGSTCFALVPQDWTLGSLNLPGDPWVCLTDFRRP